MRLLSGIAVLCAISLGVALALVIYVTVKTGMNKGNYKMLDNPEVRNSKRQRGETMHIENNQFFFESESKRQKQKQKHRNKEVRIRPYIGVICERPCSYETFKHYAFVCRSWSPPTTTTTTRITSLRRHTQQVYDSL